VRALLLASPSQLIASGVILSSTKGIPAGSKPLASSPTRGDGDHNRRLSVRAALMSRSRRTSRS
jgi:hypothetical protein